MDQAAVASVCWLALAGPALADTPAPTAQTLAPANVTQTTATGRGTIDTHGEAGSYHFTVITYGTEFVTSVDRPESMLPARDGAREVAVELSDLHAASGYGYRLVVTTPGGVVTTEDRNFTTLPFPPVVSSPYRASTTFPVGARSLDLRGPFDLNGQMTSGSARVVIRSPDGTEQATAEQPFTRGGTAVGVFTGLSPHTTYSAWTVATNAGGSTTGPVEQFTTNFDPPEILPQPFTAVGSTRALAHAVVDTNGPDASLRFFCDEGPATEYSTASAGGPRSYEGVLTGLTPDTDYQCHVRVNAAGGDVTAALEPFRTARAGSDAPTKAAFAPRIQLFGSRADAARRLRRSGGPVVVLADCGASACTGSARARAILGGHRTARLRLAPSVFTVLPLGSQGLVLRSTRSLRSRLVGARRGPRFRIRIEFEADDGARAVRSIVLK